MGRVNSTSGSFRPRPTPGAGSSSSSAPPGSPGTQESVAGQRSQWNGYKRMSPEVQDAIRQFDAASPKNVLGRMSAHPQEHGMVFLDRGGNALVKGKTMIGDEAGVAVGPEITDPKARVAVHSHPFTGRHRHFEPSPADQLIARRHRHVEHIVQTPARGDDIPNQYMIYSGAVPPRHYLLVENPDNLPVSPRSEDGAMPPFRPKPPSA